MRLSPLLSKKRRRRLPSSSLSTQPLAPCAPLTSSTLQLSCLSAAGVVQITPSWRGLKLNICAAVGAAAAEDASAASNRPLVNQLFVIPDSFRVVPDSPWRRMSLFSAQTTAAVQRKHPASGGIPLGNSSPGGCPPLLAKGRS